MWWSNKQKTDSTVLVLPNGGFRLNLDNREVQKKINDNLVAALSIDIEPRRGKSDPAKQSVK